MSTGHSARPARDPRPADVFACQAYGCRRDDDLELVVRDDGENRVLCPFHAKHFLEVST